MLLFLIKVAISTLLAENISSCLIVQQKNNTFDSTTIIFLSFSFFLFLLLFFLMFLNSDLRVPIKHSELASCFVVFCAGLCGRKWTRLRPG